METFISKVAGKNKDGKNFTSLGLQVFVNAQEQRLLRVPSITSLHWLSYCWEVERNLCFGLDGAWEFVGKVKRCKRSRESTGSPSKLMIEVEKDICGIDLHLSSMVRAKDEAGEMISFSIQIDEVQIEAELQEDAE